MRFARFKDPDIDFQTNNGACKPGIGAGGDSGGDEISFKINYELNNVSTQILIKVSI